MTGSKGRVSGTAPHHFLTHVSVIHFLTHVSISAGQVVLMQERSLPSPAGEAMKGE
jgi:hypothetical protein